MDRVYRRQRHFYDISREYYLLGRDHLIRSMEPGTGSVLEIGCGTGRNLIDAARAHPHARFYGIDISTQMLRTARSKIDKAGLTNRIRVARGDATSFDPAALFGTARFDRVFFSYALSIIPDWPAALALGLGTLTPGGRVQIVDFGLQEGLPPMFRKMFYAWLARFHVTPMAHQDWVVSGMATARGAAYSSRALFRGYVWYAEATASGT